MSVKTVNPKGTSKIPLFGVSLCDMEFLIFTIAIPITIIKAPMACFRAGQPLRSHDIMLEHDMNDMRGLSVITITCSART